MNGGVDSAGNISQEESSGESTKEICAVTSIICKRKYVNWEKARVDNLPTSANRAQHEKEVFEYLIEWEDNKKTWEQNKNLASIKERVKQFNLDAELRLKEKDPRARNQEIQRKRMLKMQNKGSFEKKNQIK